MNQQVDSFLREIFNHESQYVTKIKKKHSSKTFPVSGNENGISRSLIQFDSVPNQPYL